MGRRVDRGHGASTGADHVGGSTRGCYRYATRVGGSDERSAGRVGRCRDGRDGAGDPVRHVRRGRGGIGVVVGRRMGARPPSCRDGHLDHHTGGSGRCGHRHRRRGARGHCGPGAPKAHGRRATKVAPQNGDALATGGRARTRNHRRHRRHRGSGGGTESHDGKDSTHRNHHDHRNGQPPQAGSFPPCRYGPPLVPRCRHDVILPFGRVRPTDRLIGVSVVLVLALIRQ